MICIQDFCGNSTSYGTTKYQVNFWADWCPRCKEIWFGGYWQMIPNLFSETEPSENDQFVIDHIKEHEPACEKAYWDYIYDNKAE